jgi:isocitrate/isopropylmalate dehydrogenase
MTKRTHRIASIPGDGIGKEVIPEGLLVLEAAASKFGFELQVDSFNFACVDYYEKHGCMMPADWKQTLKPYDASSSVRSAGRRRFRTTFRSGDRSSSSAASSTNMSACVPCD